MCFITPERGHVDLYYASHIWYELKITVQKHTWLELFGEPY